MRAPEHLSAEHDLSSFDCSNEDLNDWLRSRARDSESRSARTYVVAVGKQVIGYYCLSTGSVERAELPTAKIRKNTPDPVPVLVIGRLAVDRQYQGKGFGKWLLRDAILRCLSVSEQVGFRAIVIHALDDKGVAFYRSMEFIPCPLNAKTLVLPIEHAKTSL